MKVTGRLVPVEPDTGALVVVVAPSVRAVTRTTWAWSA